MVRALEVTKAARINEVARFKSALNCRVLRSNVFVDRFNSCKSHINSLSFSIPAKPIRPGQQPASPSVRPGSSSGIGSALLGMTRLAGGAVMGSNVPNSPSTPSIPSSPNGATIVTPVIRGSKGSEPVVTYSKRIRNAVSTESLNRPLPQGSAR